MVQLPMPRIERSRRQPRSWSRPRRSTRPVATSRAAPHERYGPHPREAQRLKPSRCLGGQRGRIRGVAKAGPRTRPPEPVGQPPLDLGGALELDQLLAYGPRQRLERFRPTEHADPRIGADGGTDQRVEPEPLVELSQVLVDAEGKPHPLDCPLGRRAVIGLRPEKHPTCAWLRDANDDRALLVVQEAMQYPIPYPSQAVGAAVPWQPERPARADLDAEVDSRGHSPGLPIRCTSTRNVRLPTIGSMSIGRLGPLR